MPLSRAVSRSLASLDSVASAVSTASRGIQKDPKPIDKSKPRKQGSLPYIMRATFSAVSFLLMTIIYVLDLATDIWVVIIFARDDMLTLLGFSIVIFAFTSLIIGFMYVFNIKKMQPDITSMAMALCMFINFPLHLGIMYERVEHQVYKFTLCCRRMSDQILIIKDWIFAKLKMAHATFQSAPFLIINIVLILQNPPHGHVAFQVGALFSYLSLVFSASLHEINRKHYQQDNMIGMSRVFCIFAFNTVLLAARMLAIAHFVYFFGAYLAAIIVAHVFIVFLYFIIVYRNVWKINLGRMALHTIYCIFSYFPIHNDYRPEGEIMGYYGLYLIENIIMVALPFKMKPTELIYPMHEPGTVYYKVVTIVVLIGTAVGLILLAFYYFCLHRERSTIRSDHFACLSYCCPPCWCCRREKTASASPKRGPIYVNPEHATTQESRLTVPEPQDGQPFLQEIDDSAPPAYADISLKKPKPAPRQPRQPAPDISYEDETKTPLTTSTESAVPSAPPKEDQGAADIGDVYKDDKEATGSMAAELEKLRASNKKPEKKKLSNPFKKSKK